MFLFADGIIVYIYNSNRIWQKKKNNSRIHINLARLQEKMSIYKNQS